MEATPDYLHIELNYNEGSKQVKTRLEFEYLKAHDEAVIYCHPPAVLIEGLDDILTDISIAVGDYLRCTIKDIHWIPLRQPEPEHLFI
jgi:hypothetical protein